jgi:ElaB/YqjD/DUF883 family membrane-anchored ribosome-binding protein
MSSKDELRAEVLRLRTEIDELRRMRETTAHKNEPEDDDDDDDLAEDREALRGLEGQFRELKRAVADLADDAGDEIAERPLVSVLGAFILGVVVARLLSR